jgi:spore coat protein U-like protein
MLRRLACGPALAVLAAVPGAGGASIGANTLAVSVTVVSSCRISSSEGRFESDPQGAVSVKSNCTTRSAYSISVTPGAPPPTVDGALRVGLDGPAVTVSY